MLRTQTNVGFQQSDRTVNPFSQDVCLGELLRLLQHRTAGTALDGWGTGLVGPTLPCRKSGPIKAWGPLSLRLMDGHLQASLGRMWGCSSNFLPACGEGDARRLGLAPPGSGGEGDMEPENGFSPPFKAHRSLGFFVSLVCPAGTERWPVSY